MFKPNGELVVGKPIAILDNGADLKIQKEIAYSVGYALFLEEKCVGLFTLEEIEYLPLKDLGEL